MSYQVDLYDIKGLSNSKASKRDHPERHTYKSLNKKLKRLQKREEHLKTNIEAMKESQNGNEYAYFENKNKLEKSELVVEKIRGKKKNVCIGLDELEASRYADQYWFKPRGDRNALLKLEARDAFKCDFIMF